ncbi:MAG TPA: hypothetical protein VIC32_01285 [Terriglobales bacterium]|jgi:hypothetical protein
MLPPLPPQVRRRNRRLGLLLGLVALACALWTPYATHHGWIQPIETTFAFPHWMK